MDGSGRNGGRDSSGLQCVGYARLTPQRHITCLSDNRLRWSRSGWYLVGPLFRHIVCMHGRFAPLK